MIQFAFRMSEVRQTLYANNWQEKVSTLFLKEERHWDNFCLMVNLRDQTGERIFATGFHASVVLSVTLERLLNGETIENPSTREVWKTKTRITASTYIWRTIQSMLLDGNKCLFLLRFSLQLEKDEGIIFDSHFLTHWSDEYWGWHEERRVLECFTSLASQGFFSYRSIIFVIA